MKRKFKECWSTIPPKSTKQNNLSPQTTEHKKRLPDMALETQVLAWDRLKKVTGLDSLLILPCAD